MEMFEGSARDERTYLSEEGVTVTNTHVRGNATFFLDKVTGVRVDHIEPPLIGPGIAMTLGGLVLIGMVAVMAKDGPTPTTIVFAVLGLFMGAGGLMVRKLHAPYSQVVFGHSGGSEVQVCTGERAFCERVEAAIIRAIEDNRK